MKAKDWLCNDVLATAVNMQSRGITIDQEEVARLTRTHRSRIAARLARLKRPNKTDKVRVFRTKSGPKVFHVRARDAINPGSPIQVGKVLLTNLAPDTDLRLTKTGRIQLREEDIDRMAVQNPDFGFLQNLKVWKKSSKVLGTYLKTLRGWGPVARPDLYLVSGHQGRTGVGGTITGRITMALLQTFPRDGELKRCIVSADPGGTIVVADYSQIELLIAAMLAGEKTMLRMYADPEVDLHCEMASRIFGRKITKADDEERQVGKRTNFATIYGVTPEGLAAQLWTLHGIRVSLKLAERCITQFFRLYPAFGPWHVRQTRALSDPGYVKTPTGRILRPNDRRQAINGPVQSGAADLCTASMVLLDRGGYRPIINQYDSVACDLGLNAGPERVEEVKRIMTLDTPKYLYDTFGWKFKVKPAVDVKVGRTWQ